jgi:acetyl esterase/lipase
VKAPTYILDAAVAVAWVFTQIEEYGGSLDRIFVARASGGGYLALMVGLDQHRLETHNIEANRIAGLISISGQMITHFTRRARN